MCLTVSDGVGTDLDCFGSMSLGATLEIQGNASFESGSQLILYSAILNGPVAMYILAGATIDFQGNDKTLGGGIAFNNYSNLLIEFTDVLTLDNNASINNYGQITIDNTPTITSAPSGNGQFNNEIGGIIEIGGFGDPIFGTDLQFNNFGDFSVYSQVRMDSYSGSNSGTYTVASGAELNGNGTISFSGENFSNDGTVNLAQLEFSGTSNQNLNGTGSINSLSIASGQTVLLSGDQTITQTLNLGSGFINTGAGKIIISDGASITNPSANSFIVVTF